MILWIQVDTDPPSSKLHQDYFPDISLSALRPRLAVHLSFGRIVEIM
jgi:hypothetical protein